MIHKHEKFEFFTRGRFSIYVSLDEYIIFEYVIENNNLNIILKCAINTSINIL
jgi:hypothetical protein